MLLENKIFFFILFKFLFIFFNERKKKYFFQIKLNDFFESKLTYCVCSLSGRNSDTETLLVQISD